MENDYTGIWSRWYDGKGYIVTLELSDAEDAYIERDARGHVIGVIAPLDEAGYKYDPLEAVYAKRIKRIINGEPHVSVETWRRVV